MQPIWSQRANALTARWVSRSANGRSWVLAGSGVWPLLALLGAAAQGQGRAELTTAAGLAGDEAVVAARDMLTALHLAASTSLALGVWLAGGVEVTEWWRSSVPPGTSHALTRDPAVDQAAIDSWVRENSSGLIDRVSCTLDEDTLMLLASALVVRAKWVDPFEPSMLMPVAGPWAGRRIDGLSRSTYDQDELRLVTGASTRVTLLSVAGEDDVEVHLALGADGVSPAEVLSIAIEALAGEHHVLPGSALSEEHGAPGVTVGVHSFDERPRLDAALPRFTVTSSHDLLAAADLFGLEAVTDDRHGHFPGLSAFPLAVQRAVQDITATFSEVGFEAAAATVVDFKVAGVPPLRPRSLRLHFDRPFGFVAIHRDSQLIILTGWVADANEFEWPGTRR